MLSILSVVNGRNVDWKSLERRWDQGKGLMREMIANPLTATGFVITGTFVLMAILAPILAPETGGEPYQMPRNWGTPLAPPLSGEGLLGTTSNGGNILYGIIWGSRLSIAISLSVVTISVLIGVTVGTVAGYVGGWVDEILMRTVDGMIAVPAIVLALALVVALGPSYFNIGVALAVMLWGTYARIIRGEVMHVKNEEYVDAARVTGVSDFGVVVKEVLPNAIQPIFIQATLEMGSVVIIASGLAFLGLAEPGLAEWGRLTAQGQPDLLRGLWWTSVIPGAAIFLWAFAWNLIGDGLRDVLDPERNEG
jgi:peptide/nickel transport system permease protein